MVAKLTDCMTKISETDTTAEDTKSKTPIKLGKDYKEELKMVSSMTSTWREVVLRFFDEKVFSH